MDLDILRILVVEDSDGDVLALRRALSRIRLSTELVSVPTAERALKLLDGPAAGEFGLFLIDINLPGANGLDLLGELKSRLILCDTPVMVLSSSELPADISLAFDNNVDGYMVKPMDAAGYAEIARFIDNCWFEGHPEQPADYTNLILLRRPISTSPASPPLQDRWVGARSKSEL